MTVRRLLSTRDSMYVKLRLILKYTRESTACLLNKRGPLEEARIPRIKYPACYAWSPRPGFLKTARLLQYIYECVYIYIYCYCYHYYFLPEVRAIPQEFKRLRDNFFVLGWLVFDDVSAKSAMKSKCLETLDGNRQALVEECSLLPVTCNLCPRVTN